MEHKSSFSEDTISFLTHTHTAEKKKERKKTRQHRDGLTGATKTRSALYAWQCNGL
jgi:hypothetical protein